jgi:hypothetical protein
MRQTQGRIHKQGEQNQSLTVLILLVLIIAASISLSSCGFTTAAQTDPASSSLTGLSANPTSLNFSTVAVGSSSSLTSTLTNNGNSNINISEVVVTGAGLTTGGVSGGTILTPGQSAIVNVTFAPAGAGSLAGASVKIMSDASNSPLTISVSGTGQTSSHSVELSWTASPTSGVAYDIFRANTSGGFGTTPLNPSPIAGTTYTDTTVASGQTYFYVATAVDSQGSSADSNEVSVTIP